MAHQYSIEQAQTQLAKIMSEVEQGQTIELVRSGQRIAVLLSSQDYERLTASKPSFWKALEAFRQDFNIDQEGVNDDFWEDVRDPSPGREVSL